MTRSITKLALVAAVSALPMGAMAASNGATATLIRGDGTTVGQASLTPKGDGLWLEVDAIGLTPGKHGIHLHAVGTCTGPDFASAGGHWNPMNHKHGTDAADGPHMGDLPNIEADASGKAHLATELAMASLEGGTMGLLDADGAAIVIHAGPDDYKTDPSGNSGARIACGVIKAN